MHAALQYAASLHCLVEEWQDCEEPKPQPIMVVFSPTKIKSLLMQSQREVSQNVIAQILGSNWRLRHGDGRRRDSLHVRCGLTAPAGEHRE